MSEDSNIVCHSPFMVGESRSVCGGMGVREMTPFVVS
jgi:hypothetical protein